MNTVRVELFGKDSKVQKSVNAAQKVAVSKAPLLIVGESGTGKRTLATYVHNCSTRNEEPLEIVDCSQSAEQVAGEILGYRNRETGRYVQGALQRGNGGTVVFANIECLAEDFQKRLHEVIGQLEDLDIDVRLIATTTKNLSKLVGSGRFYRGLYTIFAGVTLNLSPLRERQDDLQEIFTLCMNEEFGSDVEIDASALDKIRSHFFGQNIAEVKRIAKETVSYMTSNVVTENELAIGEKKNVAANSNDIESDGIRLMSLKDAEKLLIQKALIHTSENRTQAAKILGVSIRTLRNKINEYRVEGSSYFVNLR